MLSQIFKMSHATFTIIKIPVHLRLPKGECKGYAYSLGHYSLSVKIMRLKENEDRYVC